MSTLTPLSLATSGTPHLNPFHRTCTAFRGSGLVGSAQMCPMPVKGLTGISWMSLCIFRWRPSPSPPGFRGCRPGFVKAKSCICYCCALCALRHPWDFAKDSIFHLRRLATQLSDGSCCTFQQREDKTLITLNINNYNVESDVGAKVAFWKERLQWQILTSIVWKEGCVRDAVKNVLADFAR